MNYTSKPLSSSNGMMPAERATPSLHRKKRVAEVREAKECLTLTQGWVDSSTCMHNSALGRDTILKDANGM